MGKEASEISERERRECKYRTKAGNSKLLVNSGAPFNLYISPTYRISYIGPRPKNMRIMAPDKKCRAVSLACFCCPSPSIPFPLHPQSSPPNPPPIRNSIMPTVVCHILKERKRKRGNWGESKSKKKEKITTLNFCFGTNLRNDKRSLRTCNSIRDVADTSFSVSFQRKKGTLNCFFFFFKKMERLN